MGHVPGQRFVHALPAAVKHQVDLAQQGIVIAAIQEQGHGALVVGRRVAQHQAAQRPGLADQRRRADHVAQTQTWGQGLGEAAHIDHPIVAIQALQRRRGVVQVVGLALVVVLDDQEVVDLRHVEQLASPLQRHGDRGRRLVARRHVEQLAIGDRRVEAHALVVDRQQLDIVGEGAGDVVDVHVAGVLHPEATPGLEQQHAGDPQRLLGADRDQDLLGLGPHAAARQHPLVDLFDQQRIVIVEVVHRPAADRRHAHGIAAALPPVLGRKQLRVDLTVEERIVVAMPVAGLVDGLLPGGVHGQELLPGQALGVDIVQAHRFLGPALEDLGIDEVAATLPRDQVAIIEQMLVGQHHRVAGDMQIPGQLAARRQRLVQGQMTIENGAGDLLAQLFLQALRKIGIEMEEKLAHCNGVSPRLRKRLLESMPYC